MENLAINKLTIGRGLNNDIIVSNPDVSRQHARITFITENVMLLEDTDSTFGTWVNDQRIARKIITIEDSVMLAEKERLDLTAIRARFITPKMTSAVKAAVPVKEQAATPAASQDALDFREEFKKLEKMHEMYTQVSEAMMVNTPRHQAWLRASFGFVPLIGMALGPAGMIIGVLGTVVGQIVAAEAINPAEKKLTLDKEFKRNYVCPNPACKRFLGFTLFADLAHQKQCSRCKAKWM